MVRSGIRLVVTVAICLASCCSASAYKLGPELSKKLADFQCHDLFPSLGGSSGALNARDADVIAMFAPWRPAIYGELQSELGVNKTVPKSTWQKRAPSQSKFAEAILTGEQPSDGIDAVSQIINQRLAVVEKQVLSDAIAYGRAVCDVMRIQAAVGSKNLHRQQTVKPGTPQPYIAIAQGLLTAAGCDVGSLDGSMGSKTTSAWASRNKLLQCLSKIGLQRAKSH
jgi:hypothetical protein